MGIEYYLFAIFVAGLVCVVAIIFKVLFSNVKRQNQMLDERESKLLETYNAVETIMEEFQDQAKATIDELNLREQEYRAAMQNMAAFQLPPELNKKEQIIEKVPRSLPLDANRIRAAGEVIERAERLIAGEPAAAPLAMAVGEASFTPAPAPPASKASAVIAPGVAAAAQVAKPAVFQKFFDDAAEAPPPTPYAPAAASGGSRRDFILALAEEGKSDVEIASQLGITRNEVQLVIGLTR